MSVQLLGWHSDKQHRLQTVTWYRWNGHKKAKDWVKSTTTVMKNGTNTKMKYQQGQTRLSSQYAKRAASKFTLRTYISLLPYQEADHITFEAGWEVGGRVRWVGNFWSARIFFSCKPAGQDIFCPFSFVCRIFFPQRGSVQVFVKMYLHLHCGYCSNGPDMELQSLLLWKQATSWALTLFQATKKKRKKKQDARLS